MCVLWEKSGDITAASKNLWDVYKNDVSPRAVLRLKERGVENHARVDGTEFG